MPAPMPPMRRAAKSTGKLAPNPIMRLPTISTVMPIMIIFLAWPLSANGARKIWATNPARKPTARISPSCASLTP